ncbi:MAG TPA: phosphatidylserine decarboxylase, partial [Opitutae bacterium]|nr:phosphatidylserine decarboxylase [Opitutae bacterium]
SVLTLFERDRLRISEDVRQHSQANIETYAKMGEEMGRAD